ncbi:MAG TPA: hypothetical protein PK296_03720, partial [Paludibacteraceae bacterium]|nr:hypothetical protein [Paludibacteraceae bacterium]
SKIFQNNFSIYTVYEILPFGRIDNVCSCWVPSNRRAKVGKQIIRQYTYAYTAVCPETGESYSLILPYANTLCMSLFMEGFSEKFYDYRIIMAMDKASWHTGKKQRSGKIWFHCSNLPIPLK